MERKCLPVRKRKNCKTEIYIDEENHQEIFSYIGQDNRHKNKFLDIVNIIMEGLHNRHLYRREGFDSETKSIHAMRLFVSQENDRIYCKEVSKDNKIRVVIIGILHLHKTAEGLSDIEKSLIKTLASYDYEFEG